MTSITVQHTYDVDGDQLWTRISDFYDLSWLPAVVETRRIEATASRVAVLPDGAGEVTE